MTSHLSLQRNSRLLLLPTLVVLVLAGSSAAPINTLAGSEEWRPVEPSDLALKAPIVEPDADAEAIFWDIRIDDAGSSDLVLSHYIRIKIFTDRGREKESKIDIPFLSGTKIKDVAAHTIKPDGSIVELAKEDVLERTVVQSAGVKLRTKSFAFPGIEVGCIVEYKWKEVIANASANNLRIKFQREIPVQLITYHIKPARAATIFEVQAFNMSRPQFHQEKNGFQFAQVARVPALQEEPMMPPEDTVRAWAIVKYQDFSGMMLGYQALGLQMNVAAEPYLKVDDEIKRKSAEITAGATTPEEKLEKIYAFCRANIKNTDEQSSGFTREEAGKLEENKKSGDTLKRAVGSGIDIDLLFAALANAAGFEVHLVLLPDRGRNFFNRNVVIPGALRPASVVVRIGQNWRFFNPGFHYLSSDMLPWQSEGVDALIADNPPFWVKTPMSPPEKSRETRVATLSLDANGTLEGDVSIEYTGHLAMERKALNADDSPTQREETLKTAVKSRLSTAELTNIVIEVVTDPNKPFVYRYHVRVSEYAQRTGKRLFLQPAFFQKGIPALFGTNKRRYAIYFRFPWSEEDKVTIALPKGYVVESADSPRPVTGAVSSYSAKITVTKDESTLVYNRSFFFGGKNVILLPANSYPSVKQAFDEVNKSDNHTITLKQSGPAN